MRNLKVLETVEARFSADSEGLPLTATTFDTSTGAVIYAFGPTTSKPLIELRRCDNRLKPKKSETSVITSWEAPSPLSELQCDRILSLQYLQESSSICLVLAGGDLILVREKPRPDQERIEIVGSIDVGIAAAQWSWNSSFLAVVTQAGSFVLMSRQLEPITEAALHEDDLQLSKHVSVGWGKKETQFQGKRAKALKDPTMPDSIDEGKPSPNDDGDTTISWRGDGAYVAVNSRIASSRRVVRVYSAEGGLDSVSEPVNGLESALSWRPHGNIIASVKRTWDGTPKVEVIFFERNGLRHGQFDLRLTEQETKSYGAQVRLFWNNDSSILAVRLLDRVQLWTMSNYQYYLKQEFRLKGASVDWHPTDPLQLCLYHSQIQRSIVLDFSVDCGSLCQPFDYGLVAVIDGKNLFLTPLKHANVPPPMAYTTIQADENILSCAISRTCQRLAFLTHARLYLCQMEMQPANNQSQTSLRHTTKYTVQRKDLAMSPRPTQIVIKNDDSVFLLAPATSTSDPLSFCYKHVWVATGVKSAELKTEDVNVPLTAKQILVDSLQESAWIHTDDNISPLPAENDHDKTFSTKFPSVVVKLPASEADEYCTISLSKEHQLLINGVLRASQVTSYAVTDTHLVFTTSNHLLKFVHLRDPLELTFPNDEPEVDERCRAVERGARLITVVPSTFAVILQMPRGNLETIYPRVLVVAGIRKYIRDLDYRRAFIACQTHQVDLNILFDYDPQLWYSHVERFVEQLRKPARLDEFIQKLKEEDVTRTLYRDSSRDAHQSNEVEKTGPSIRAGEKPNGICDALITVLQKQAAEYQQNIITAYICKRPPDTSAALTMVSTLRESSQDEADLAVAHLCFLTDTNRLYDAALGLYDLELTLLVAQNGQRDPREYMPFLQSLQELSELRRMFTIDHHLKRHAKALKSLHAMSEHEELEAYTVKYNLYTHAEELYKHDLPHLDRMVRVHADYLSARSEHASAAILYESLSDYELAYPAYALAHRWQESLSCACLVPISLQALQSLARSLAATCAEENRDYRSAATIYLEYLNEPTTAAELLCKSSYFADAIRIISHPAHGLVEKISDIVDPMLTRKFGEIIELIADCQTQLGSQVPRIEELRLKKLEDPLAFYGGDAALEDGVDVPDNISLAPTDASTLGGQSMFTRYGGGAGGSQVSTKFAGTVASNVSRKTSKTKRREERKRARGKKGSVYEEEYLVASVGRLIDRVNGTHDEVKRLVLGSQRRGLREQSRKVEEIMSAIQVACEDARKRIWPSSATEVINAEADGYAVNGEGRPSGAEGVLYDSQIELQEGQGKGPPEVKAWKTGV